MYTIQERNEKSKKINAKGRNVFLSPPPLRATAADQHQRFNISYLYTYVYVYFYLYVYI